MRGIAFSSLAYPNLSLVDVVERVKRFGFDALELRVHEDGIHLKPSYPLNKNVVELLKGVVCCLAGYVFLGVPQKERLVEEITKAKILALIARDIEAHVVRIFIGDFGKPLEKVIDNILNAISEILDFAHSLGVEIAIETHDIIAKTENLSLIISKAPSELRFVYDPANIIYVEGDYKKSFELIKNRIAHVHIKDFIILGNKRILVPPGKGIVPLKQIIEDLLREGYRGYLSVEWEKMWIPEIEDGDIVLPLYISYIKNIIKQHSNPIY